MENSLLIAIGKGISKFSRTIGKGNGSTWPGHIALNINPRFSRQILKKSKTKIIFVAGTNGKTTTTKLIRHVIENAGSSIITNASGANLLNGIASSLITASNFMGKLNSEYAIFEIDENTLPHAIKEIVPDYVILLNLFRDQLDRYGEVNSIAKKWQKALNTLPASSTVILNTDDPQIAFLGHDISAKTLYFGLEDKKLSQKTFQHASDSTYCPRCGTKLTYSSVYFSHLGIWLCRSCALVRKKPDVFQPIPSPLSGIYNNYNVLAAQLLLEQLKISKEAIKKSLEDFQPAFGRQETVEYDGKKIQLFLSKNPTGFNESLRTITSLGARHILFVLNDRIPDGRDISWIWDIDFEEFLNYQQHLHISGDRTYDMALRLKYARSEEFTVNSSQFTVQTNLEKAIHIALDTVEKSETLYILPTYSAMLEVRKVLLGKKIL